uniref:Uncharacterized protein n=1 Tax=Arundo donax TaxID=35708 RepID=A0A0A9FF10_ARUDO
MDDDQSWVHRRSWQSTYEPGFWKNCKDIQVKG